jgi:hypothetical protein
MVPRRILNPRDKKEKEAGENYSPVIGSTDWTFHTRKLFLLVLVTHRRGLDWWIDLLDTHKS